jgi:biopolymer transport protein ExbB
MLLALALATTAACAQAPAAPAANAPAAASASEAEAPQGFWGIVFSGGLIGVLIMMVLIGLSVAAVALVIEHLLTIRAPVLMPPGLAEKTRDQLQAGSLSGADQLCQANPSFLAFVLRAGFAEVEGGWSAVEEAMEDAAAEQSARLFRKVEYLSVIGNIAPMVGLLGTVTGMLLAFKEVAETQGAANAGDLAEGIYQALVTTVVGLLIAIPSLGAFAIFRNRVDQLVAEIAYAALHVTAPLKRARVRRAASVASPAPPPVGGAS